MDNNQNKPSTIETFMHIGQDPLLFLAASLMSVGVCVIALQGLNWHRHYHY